MRITKKEGENIILFEDKDDDSGQTTASIGFQTRGGKFTVYMKGYEVDPVKFPALKGFYGYQLTDEELNILTDFLERMGQCSNNITMPRTVEEILGKLNEIAYSDDRPYSERLNQQLELLRKVKAKVLTDSNGEPFEAELDNGTKICIIEEEGDIRPSFPWVKKRD